MDADPELSFSEAAVASALVMLLRSSTTVPKTCRRSAQSELETRGETMKRTGLTSKRSAFGGFEIDMFKAGGGGNGCDLVQAIDTVPRLVNLS